MTNDDYQPMVFGFHRPGPYLDPVLATFGLLLDTIGINRKRPGKGLRTFCCSLGWQTQSSNEAGKPKCSMIVCCIHACVSDRQRCRADWHQCNFTDDLHVACCRYVALMLHGSTSELPEMFNTNDSIKHQAFIG